MIHKTNGTVKRIGGNKHAYIELSEELTKKDAAIVPGTAVQDDYLSAKALERLEAELMACWLLMHEVPTREGYEFGGWTGTGLAEPIKEVEDNQCQEYKTGIEKCRQKSI